jgi:bis(5'-nucleosyl)-tetraphosphatase (symmetrical)
MSTWVIGDVHGHYGALLRLVEEAAIDPATDRVWFVGDLVNGGGQNTEVVRWAADVDAKVSLGNHDLHMLAVWAGSRDIRDKDDFQDLLDAPDCDELIAWLRTRDIVIHDPELDALIVHAGLLPEWTPEQADALGNEVEAVLQSGQWPEFAESMYGNEPDRWSGDLAGDDRLRVIVNATTRMRVLDDEGRMEFDFKGTYEEIPSDRTPWFEWPGRASADTLCVFGHWSALGLKKWSDVVALDSGVRWGGELSGLRVEDRKVVSVSSEP